MAEEFSDNAEIRPPNEDDTAALENSGQHQDGTRHDAVAISGKPRIGTAGLHAQRIGNGVLSSHPDKPTGSIRRFLGGGIARLIESSRSFANNILHRASDGILRQTRNSTAYSDLGEFSATWLRPRSNNNDNLVGDSTSTPLNINTGATQNYRSFNKERGGQKSDQRAVGQNDSQHRGIARKNERTANSETASVNRSATRMRKRPPVASLKQTATTVDRPVRSKIHRSIARETSEPITSPAKWTPVELGSEPSENMAVPTPSASPEPIYRQLRAGRVYENINERPAAKSGNVLAHRVNESANNAGNTPNRVTHSVQQISASPKAKSSGSNPTSIVNRTVSNPSNSAAKTKGTPESTLESDARSQFSGLYNDQRGDNGKKRSTRKSFIQRAFSMPASLTKTFRGKPQESKTLDTTSAIAVSADPDSDNDPHSESRHIEQSVNSAPNANASNIDDHANVADGRPRSEQEAETVQGSPSEPVALTGKFLRRAHDFVFRKPQNNPNESIASHVQETDLHENEPRNAKGNAAVSENNTSKNGGIQRAADTSGSPPNKPSSSYAEPQRRAVSTVNDDRNPKYSRKNLDVDTSESPLPSREDLRDHERGAKETLRENEVDVVQSQARPLSAPLALTRKVLQRSVELVLRKTPPQKVEFGGSNDERSVSSRETHNALQPRKQNDIISRAHKPVLGQPLREQSESENSGSQKSGRPESNTRSMLSRAKESDAGHEANPAQEVVADSAITDSYSPSMSSRSWTSGVPIARKVIEGTKNLIGNAPSLVFRKTAAQAASQTPQSDDLVHHSKGAMNTASSSTDFKSNSMTQRNEDFGSTYSASSDKHQTRRLKPSTSDSKNPRDIQPSYELSNPSAGYYTDSHGQKDSSHLLKNSPKIGGTQFTFAKDQSDSSVSQGAETHSHDGPVIRNRKPDSDNPVVDPAFEPAVLGEQSNEHGTTNDSTETRMLSGVLGRSRGIGIGVQSLVFRDATSSNRDTSAGENLVSQPSGIKRRAGLRISRVARGSVASMNGSFNITPRSNKRASSEMSYGRRNTSDRVNNSSSELADPSANDFRFGDTATAANLTNENVDVPDPFGSSFIPRRSLVKTNPLARFSKPMTRQKRIAPKIRKHDSLVGRKVENLNISDHKQKAQSVADSLPFQEPQPTPNSGEANQARLERLRALAMQSQDPESPFVYKMNRDGHRSENSFGSSHHLNHGSANGMAASGKVQRAVVPKMPTNGADKRTNRNPRSSKGMQSTVRGAPLSYTVETSQVQRAVGVPRMDSGMVDTGVDEETNRISGEELDYVANKVYTFVKQKMMTERERHGRPGWTLWS